MTSPPTNNRQQLNASLDRLRSALAKIEKSDQRRGVRSGRANSLYAHVIQTVDGLTTAITGEAQPVLRDSRP
jgi:hypothetical protein